MSAIPHVVSSETNVSRGNNVINKVSPVVATTQRKHSILSAILERFDNDPSVALTTADIAMPIYGINDYRNLQKKHRVAVIRAMWSTTSRRKELRVFDGGGAEGQLVLFNSHDVESYAMARIKADWVYCYQRPRGFKDRTPTEADLHQILLRDDNQKNIRGGGAWDRHVKQYIAEDAGDRLTALQCRHETLTQICRMAIGGGANPKDYLRELEAVAAEIKELEKERAA